MPLGSSPRLKTKWGKQSVIVKICIFVFFNNNRLTFLESQGCASNESFAKIRKTAVFGKINFRHVAKVDWQSGSQVHPLEISDEAKYLNYVSLSPQNKTK